MSFLLFIIIVMIMIIIRIMIIVMIMIIVRIMIIVMIINNQVLNKIKIAVRISSRKGHI